MSFDRLKYHRERRKYNAPRALIVDDDVESILPLQIVLKNYGFDTVLAFDGKEALAEIENNSFDIVFLDIQVPEMSGLEVLEKVYLHDGKCLRHHPHLPIVTYSSYPMSDYEIPDGKNFYFADHWQKPISFSDLTTLTNHTLDQMRIKKEVFHETQYRMQKF